MGVTSMENIEREVSRPEADGDDWHNVKDAKKRKQIQDKLAQRARRGYLHILYHCAFAFAHSPARIRHLLLVAMPLGRDIPPHID